MIWLAITGLSFATLHTLPATPLRAKLVGVLGENTYVAIFSISTATIIVLWVLAFKATLRESPLWMFPVWWPWVKAAIMLFAFFLFVASLSAANPTLPQGAKLVAQEAPVRGVTAITRHPGLASFGIWGVTHLISQPDLRGLLFFGVFALVAFGGMALIDMRRAVRGGEAWVHFVAQTSRLPFLAIIQGRAVLRLKDIDWARVAIAVVLWGAVLYFHNWLFGANALPGWL
jgi:uncharacterized membrane protein